MRRDYPLFECAATMIILGVGVLMLLNPSTVNYGALKYNLFSHVLPRGAFVALFVVMAAVRAVGLYTCTNDLWPTWGPRLRVIGALFGSSVWFQSSVAIFTYGQHQGGVSMGLVVYSVLTLCELESCRRAALMVAKKVPPRVAA